MKQEAPVFFLKPRSAVIRPGSPIVRPYSVADLHHEVELGVVIGARARRIASADWRSYVGGYVLALDMTARDKQAAAKAAGQPWTLGKAWVRGGGGGVGEGDCVGSSAARRRVRGPPHVRAHASPRACFHLHARAQDTFAPMSHIIDAALIPDPGNVTLWLKVRGRRGARVCG